MSKIGPKILKRSHSTAGSKEHPYESLQLLKVWFLDKYLSRFDM